MITLFVISVYALIVLYFVRDTTWLIDEPNTYRVLLRGHAPQSEPFRKWVTEEVLPTIRKTGKYDIAQSTTDTGKQLAAEFSALRGRASGINCGGKESEGNH